MARASNVYAFVYTAAAFYSRSPIVATFTVKREAIDWAKRTGVTSADHSLWRYRDGAPRIEPVQLEDWDK